MDQSVSALMLLAHMQFWIFYTLSPVTLILQIRCDHPYQGESPWEGQMRVDFTSGKS